MTHDEMVALIRGGVTSTAGVWADFGAGTGSFTRALRDLLGASTCIYAIDRDFHALDLLRSRWPPGDSSLHTITADFTDPLDLPPLDGILMANALHFVRSQQALLGQAAAYLRPGGRLLLVEYDVERPRAFIPYPVPYPHFAALALRAGFANTARVGARRSPSTGMVMYAASGERQG